MRLLLFSFCILTIISCSPLSKGKLNQQFRDTELKFQDFTGFALYDLESKKMIYEYNSDKYFTPASNTKIFTFFSSLKILGDSMPALRYLESSDSLIVWGTGDPSFLYKNVYQNDRTYWFLARSPRKIYYSNENFQTTSFGSGWAWDDYNDYYAAERSGLPVYGNIFTVKSSNQKLSVYPRLMKKFIALDPASPGGVVRDVHSNNFSFQPTQKNYSKDVPLKTDPLLTIQLLSDTLMKDVVMISRKFSNDSRTYYSVPTDSLYRVMMQDSDNFIAEQLLLACAATVSDTLKPEIAIRYMKKNYLSDMTDEPSWVDGSGLSRYNLFTPRSIVQLWEKIYGVVPRERLFPLLATGGKSGTIKNWYKGDQPYIFGKTGSLSNNHCLSGYLVTRKGKTLIFSYMNNNFTAPTAEVRRNMQNLFKLIYEKY